MTVVDNFSSECLAIHVDHSIRVEEVVGGNAGVETFCGKGSREDTGR